MNKNKLKQSFNDLGYIIIPQALAKNEYQAIQQRILELVESWNYNHDSIVFNSQSTAHHRHDYFLKSADAIHFFFEEGVLNQKRQLNRPQHLAMNKVGHSLHIYHPCFKKFCDHPTIQMVTQNLQIDPVWVCSMFIFKQPFVGGEILPHQDASYLYTFPQSLISFWFAIENATEENGCLWVLPGGHKKGLKYRSYLTPQNIFAQEIYNDTPWLLDDFVSLPVKEGSLIVFDGLLPHYSRPNRSSKSRHAYILQGFDRRSTYASDNWIPLKK